MKASDFFYPEETNFSDAEERAYAREELVYNVTEDLLVFLEDHDISKTELARRLGKSRSYVTQVLSGSRNMTLGSFSDICFALGFKPEIKIPLQEQAEHIEFDDIIEFCYEDFEISFNFHESFVSDEALNFHDSSTKHVTIKKTSSNVIDRRNLEFWEKAA